MTALYILTLARRGGAGGLPGPSPSTSVE